MMKRGPIMKTNRILFRLIAAFIAVGQAGTIANAASTSGTASAVVEAPLTVAQDAEMNFGTVTGGATPGTVVLDTAGARTVTGGAQVIALNPGSAGIFTITGEAGRTYVVTFSASATLSDGSNTMTVDSFTHNSSGTLVGNSESFQVGGTLNVGANQISGSYSTTNAGGSPFTITVNYN